MRERHSIVFIILLLLLYSVVFAAFYQECSKNERKILAVYSTEQERILEEIFDTEKQEDAVSFETRILDRLKEQVQTSASVYGCVTKEGKIIFLRDSSYSAGFQGKLFEQEFLRPRGSQTVFPPEGGDTYQAVSDDGEKFLITIQYKTVDGYHYGVGILSRRNYILRRYGADSLKSHLLILVLILEFTLLFSTFYLLSCLGHRDREIAALQNECRNQNRNREEKNEGGILLENKIYPQNVLYSVIDNLSKTQKASARLLSLVFPSDGSRVMDSVIEIFTVIGEKNWMGCFDSEKTALILLLNVTEESAEAYKDCLQDRLTQKFGLPFKIFWKTLPG